MATKRHKDRPPTHKTRIVRNRSSRGDVRPSQVCIHSTESQDVMRSMTDINGVVSWFDNPGSQASSHIIVDGDGNSAQCVPSSEKAWTALQANPFTLNIEFIGRAAQGKSAWEVEQLKTGAKWTAFWALTYGFPIQRGSVGNSHGVAYPKRKGIITHLDVTRAGFGSHVDPGPNFPMADFIKYAQYYRARGWELAVSA